MNFTTMRRIWGRWFGAEGERRAARFLRDRGMRVLLQGYRTSQGEIDLICRDGDIIVFVEVKTRRQGAPAEAVDLRKQRRVTLAAVHFLKRYRLLDARSRFDVIALRWPEGHAEPIIEYFPNAFYAVGLGQMHY